MKTFAVLPANERNNLFRQVSDQMQLSEAIIEKDFWVCWVLDYLFRQSEWKNDLYFKGGTSLSKSYNLIHRFSEDIDLILDWNVLGYLANEPWENRSKKDQESFNWNLKSRIHGFLKNQFIPAIKEGMVTELDEAKSLNESESNIEIFADPENGAAVNIIYPQNFTDPALRQFIRIEIATPAIMSYIEPHVIEPYTSLCFPNLFSNEKIIIPTVLPECTFWEKITILHREANRPKESPFPERYSRHYYDIYCMFSSDVKQNAFEKKEILEQAAEFKQKFYPQSWARYNEARIGTVKLLPPDYNLNVLKKDYENMQIMIFKNSPSFQEIIDVLYLLELEINRL